MSRCNDNQIRFQDLENTVSSEGINKKVTKKTNSNTEEVLPGSSQPQDLGSISYKDQLRRNISTNSID